MLFRHVSLARRDTGGDGSAAAQPAGEICSLHTEPHRRAMKSCRHHSDDYRLSADITHQQKGGVHKYHRPIIKSAVTHSFETRRLKKISVISIF